MTLSLQRPVIERVRENEDKYISFSGRRKVFFFQTEEKVIREISWFAPAAVQDYYIYCSVVNHE